ncbi:MAG: aminotransferase class V-fold PLP-dependent enzyme [Gammaproteobacteria bacterium]|nr:aminotransferase class V-fold PLP-dependent enzyme [Gammaproteobacteria bacterium]
MIEPLDEWCLEDEIVYLNHAAVSPWPRRTVEAISRFALENSTHGSLHYPLWIKKETELKKQLATLINAKSLNDIALLKNTSEALSIIAHGLQWKTGDNIVTSNQEFPSNRIPWESLKDQGVETRLASLQSSSPEQSLMDTCDENTRLLSISSIQYASGLVMDLDVLGAFCKKQNILFCVDAIQSLGVLPFDVQTCQADFVAADGHKWMCGPEGLALFYCRPELREQLLLRQFGWHMVEDLGNYDRMDWQAAKTARRFECGSPNMLGIFGLSASLSLLLETGIEQVSKEILKKSRFLMQNLKKIPDIKLISPEEDGRFGGIVSFSHSGGKTSDLFQFLQQHGIFCALRAGGIRLSPHFYTPESKLEKVVELVQVYKA